mmetsp:Transcript_50716/g.158443  ORF Transcript_50716/g.158443 Transcript_50716/m.158443 type:complete len:208 (-) Transcript_50716:2759-3382(-)
MHRHELRQPIEHVPGLCYPPLLLLRLVLSLRLSTLINPRPLWPVLLLLRFCASLTGESREIAPEGGREETPKQPAVVLRPEHRHGEQPAEKPPPAPCRSLASSRSKRNYLFAHLQTNKFEPQGCRRSFNMFSLLALLVRRLLEGYGQSPAPHDRCCLQPSHPLLRLPQQVIFHPRDRNQQASVSRTSRDLSKGALDQHASARDQGGG